MSDIPVAEFYAGKSVFITGGTGFLGKVIVEKILYSCPDVKNIFLLVREKRNCSVQQRLQTLCDSPVFERLRAKNRQQLTKITPIAGDMVLPGLGIKEQDEKVLLEQVSIVIHTAATVKFNEPLPVALNVNFEGTKKVLDLCRRMKNMQVLIHVSTAYANTMDKIIEEKIYPSPTDVPQLYKKLEKYTGKDSELICGWPNTYSFTKALTETLVAECHGNIPTVIVRPSIVTASISEPIEGWVDNWYGGTGYMTPIAMGLCRLMLTHKNNIVDLIPVDYVANVIILAAAKCQVSKEVKILNCCSGGKNPITMGQFENMFTENVIREKINDVPYPKAFQTRNKWLAWVVIFIAEIIPTFLADLFLIVMRKPTRFMKKQKLVSSTRNSLEHFTINSWVMRSDNVQQIIASLSPQEALAFPCDVNDICWPNYMTTYVNGVKRFLLDKKCKL